MAQINLSSNIVNGVYSMVSILLIVALTRIIRVILSCHNLYTIYDARKPLHLKTTRLSILMDPGLASGALPRLFALLCILVGVLLSAGGFAFSGTTEEVFQTVQVRNKVVAAARGNYIDFQKHVSLDGQFVSATVPLVNDFGQCVSYGARELVIFSSINDMDDVDDLNQVKWPRATRLSNITCLSREFGFVDEISFSFPMARSNSTPCSISYKRNVLFSSFQSMQIPNPTDVLDLGNCTRTVRVVDLWCSSYWEPSCVAYIEVDEDQCKYWTFLFQLQNEELNVACFLEEVDSEVLKSMAFLFDFYSSFLSITPRAYKMIASRRVEKNATTQKRAGERNITMVNIGLFVGTFGTALTISIGMAVAALGVWFRVVWLKGRRGYVTQNDRVQATFS